MIDLSRNYILGVCENWRKPTKLGSRQSTTEGSFGLLLQRHFECLLHLKALQRSWTFHAVLSASSWSREFQRKGMSLGNQTPVLGSVSPKHQQYLLQCVTFIRKWDPINSEKGKERDSSVLKAKQNLKFCRSVGIYLTVPMPGNFFSYPPCSLEYQTESAFEPILSLSAIHCPVSEAAQKGY